MGSLRLWENAFLLWPPLGGGSVRLKLKVYAEHEISVDDCAYSKRSKMTAPAASATMALIS